VRPCCVHHLQVLPVDGGELEQLPSKGSWSETLQEVVLPVGVLLVGMGVSLLALKPLLWGKA
jgi:hypothetical protein